MRRDLQNMENISINLTYTDMKWFRCSIYEIRRKLFLNYLLQTSIQLAIEQLNEMQNKIQYKGEQLYFMSDEKNIIEFTCKINLEAIGDKTFTYAPKIVCNYILYNTYTILRNYNNSQVYGFLRNKQK